MNIGITTKFGLKDPHRILKNSIALLRTAGMKVDVCPNTCRLSPGMKPGLDFLKLYDVIIVYGGDGSVLRTLQFVKHFETPLLPINMGRLGFFSEGKAKDYQSILRKVLRKQYSLDDRMLLRVSVMRGTKRVFSKRALNEVTIARDTIARMVSLRATVDDLKLTTFISDGLIVATPTGSTGYSLSAGGPVVSPQLDSILLTPIAPHSFTQRPILLVPSSRIRVSVSSRRGEKLYLTVDGQIGFRLKDGDQIKIKRSSKRLRLVSFKKNSYFHLLRSKLHWGTNSSELPS